MRARFSVLLLLHIVVLYACDPMATQPPPVSPGQIPANPGNPVNTSASAPQNPDITGSQRWQHAWNKAMEGIAMGGSLAGPYGAGGGLIIGLITGLVTADSYYGQINNQISTEQKKDQQLEAAIDQELARQRGLENQIAQAGDSSAKTDPPVQPVSNPTAQPRDSAQPSSTKQLPGETTSIASLGKPAVAQTPPSPFKNVEVRDLNGDGVADLWIYYNPQKPGEIIRQEESTKGDGRVDTWSYFKEGKMVRREVDTKQLGRPDTVYFYDNDKIIREERDEAGLGSITYRAIYQNGRLAKLEKDTSGAGRPDLWIYYDASKDGEVVFKEERDLNGDGVADLWTYYENGRLVRRDVSAVGLEILSKKEELPAAMTELTKISLPGDENAADHR
jgi:antitoxin component YwqK of YwqJK toxin-antitoxin module